MKRLLPGVASVLVGCGDEGGAPPLGDATATVTHYEYAFDLATRAAHARVTLVLDTPGNCVTLAFRGEAIDTTTLRVDDAPFVEGTSLGAGSVKLCGPGHEAGDTMTIEADVTVALATVGESQVGYSISEDSDGNPFTYLVSWVEGCDQFGPCDPRPDQFARYTFRVTHPADQMVRCAGTITEVSPTETTCELEHDGAPTYSSFGFAAYPRGVWTETPLGRWGSADVTLYDREGTRVGARIDAGHHAGFVGWMEATFGPYPYGTELRILTAPTYWSGFEHPGNIVLDDRLALAPSSYLRPVQHVLDHEIAHQWAGDQTTLAARHDFVWKEAMAEYLSFVHEEMTDPMQAANTVNVWKSLSLGARYFPVPLEAPALFDYYGDVYGPGPMILFRQIEARSSRAQVIAALQSVLGSPRALSVDELLAALEASTGLALADYADAWIRGTGAPEWPRVALTYSVGGATDFLRVQQVAGGARTCAFHVALHGAAPEDRMLVAVDTAASTDQLIPVSPQPAFAVERIELDPLRECIVFPAETTLQARAMSHPWISPRAK